MNYKVIRVLNNSVVLAERISDGTEVTWKRSRGLCK